MKDYYNINTGLTTNEVKHLQDKFGPNEIFPQKRQSFISKILHVISEPMFVLLMVAAIIYFILGEPKDGLMMIVFVIGIIAIEVVQEWKTDKTLDALKNLSAPHITVIRNSNKIQILTSELVPEDIMIIQEGVKIPADGYILKQNDLRIDESSLTGESEWVWKTVATNFASQDNHWRNDYCYAGTLVAQGTATILVDKTGTSTEYGKIGKTIAEAPKEITPLQKQTNSLVKICVIIASILFLLVGIVTWINSANQNFYDRLIESILSSITLAMATIPEEFPVILTVFLSMGAWRLAKKNSLVRNLPSVETLGSVSVLCVDKTGTLTMNNMAVEEVWSIDNDNDNLVHTMGLACETNAYDPMEKAMVKYCDEIGFSPDHLFGGELIDEYPFTNELKMMGHIWHHDDEVIVAVKGSPESVLSLCELSDEEYSLCKHHLDTMSKKGLRVIAIAYSKPQEKLNIPDKITDCKLILNGFIGLSDPIRESVKDDIDTCLKAGIRTVMITGDSAITAGAIAKKLDIPSDSIITGDMIEKMTDEELEEKTKTVNIFSRVVPSHKMRIVKALKNNGEIVAMTGDGVNDAPALKYADIGIAMGKSGSDVAREAADLILLDDNFSTIVDTIRDGRRIFDNICKAIGYVFAIHIPIAVSSLLAPIMGISPDSLFLLPIHVVLLELIIDPTCSIVLERQPAENNIMDRKPRNPEKNLLDKELLIKSLLQGVVISIVSFGIYYATLLNGSANVARSMGLCVIMLANLLLVQVNSSSHGSIFSSIKNLSKDKIMWGINIFTILGLGIIIYTPINNMLKLAPLSFTQSILCILLSSASVLWYEIVKLVKRSWGK